MTISPTVITFLLLLLLMRILLFHNFGTKAIIGMCFLIPYVAYEILVVSFIDLVTCEVFLNYLV